jgi:hypothetical protein
MRLAGAAEAAPSAVLAPMASPCPLSLAQASHYRLPRLLHDIRLLDLLEHLGTTAQTGRLP